MIDDEAKLDESGAYAWQPLIDEDTQELPEEFTNPAGISRGDCDDDTAGDDASCDVEATAQIEDMFMEETKPGIGILGFEGEEDGGS
ncbi:MAG: hypothetical protein ACYC6C_06630 [Coriobacteriia bacterium]